VIQVSELLLVYVIITALISASYVFLIVHILETWVAIPDYSVSSESNLFDKSRAEISFSVIIPARNEALSIKKCLSSVLASINNCKIVTEIIVIDDHSTDNTADIVRSLGDDRISLISLHDVLSESTTHNAYKKMALRVALEKATGTHIIQIDADVVVNVPYLATIADALYATDTDMIAGPVLFTGGGTMLEEFQSLDMMGMMAVTSAGIHNRNWYMANGANLIYKAGAVTFGDSNLASGDDVSAIQALSREPDKKIIFLKNKNAIVQTLSEKNWRSFYQQRIRWATKNKYMSSGKMQVMMAIPFINCLWVLLHVVGFYFFGYIAVLIGLAHYLSKVGVDYVYLFRVSKFFSREDLMRRFWAASIVHLIYIVVIGLLSLVVKKYEWKGRRVR